GNAGTMLNAAKVRLMKPSHVSAAIAGVPGSADGCQPRKYESARHNAPITAEVIGPTIPIQNSVLGSAASFSICATPPSAKRVIDRTGTLREVATNACES